jgi:predicted DCC family thiol-disulfide oxidoreductase YuxK
MDGVFIFDGYCGVCTRARNGLLRLNKTGRLRSEPMQQPGTAGRIGVTAEELLETSWFLDSSGAVFRGAKGMNAALSTAIGTELPMSIYRIPGIGAVQEMVYRWFAAHRYKFRGVTPLCESDPQRCSAPQAS